jgi:hypothetical protein
MPGRSLVVRPRLDARRGHELVDADGMVLAGFEVAASRDRGAIVVDGRRWAVRRMPAGRVWTITDGAASDERVVATITKPSAIRERFELEVAGDRCAIAPRGPIGRRRWVVAAGDEPVLEVTQGVVRRRWHDLRATGRPSAGGDRASNADVARAPSLTLVVAFVLALVDTRPPTGLRGLRGAND